MNGGHVGGSAHWLELLVVLLLTDVLRLVHFQQDVGRIAHHVGGLISGKEYGPGVAQPDDIAQFRTPDAIETSFIQTVLETGHGDNRLWFEGGGALYHILRLCHVKRQQ